MRSRLLLYVTSVTIVTTHNLCSYVHDNLHFLDTFGQYTRAIYLQQKRQSLTSVRLTMCYIAGLTAVISNSFFSISFRYIPMSNHDIQCYESTCHMTQWWLLHAEHAALLWLRYPWALMIVMKSGLSDAPPTRNPSMSGCFASSLQLSADTEPTTGKHTVYSQTAHNQSTKFVGGRRCLTM